MSTFQCDRLASPLLCPRSRRRSGQAIRQVLILLRQCDADDFGSRSVLHGFSTICIAAWRMEQTSTRDRFVRGGWDGVQGLLRSFNQLFMMTYGHHPPLGAFHMQQVLHPLPIRIMHWINAVTVIVMIGSGWKIYNDDVIFGWLHFPESIVIGKWMQYALQWHFFGMWILALNGVAYLTYGFVTGRFRRMLLPVRLDELAATVNDALRFRLAHDDPTRYNAVQKLLYIAVILLGIMIVISGLAIWKPIQFSELLALFGSFQTARLVHFLCMTGIVLFMVVHVSLALLVPQTLVAMFTGGPLIDRHEPAAGRLEPTH
jgi:thiosulfate reductase cytochrome b subunit